MVKKGRIKGWPTWAEVRHPEVTQSSRGSSSIALFLSLTGKTSVLKGLEESRLTAVVSTDDSPLLLTLLLVHTEPAGRAEPWATPGA